MKRSEAMAELLKRGEIVQWGNQHDDGAYHKLVEQRFCELDGALFKATAATPLALLTPTQFLCAQQLAKSGEIRFNTVPKAQKKHMEKLVENGWAGWRSSQPPAQFVGRVWVPTPKLIEAIDCWRKAKGSGNQ